MGKIRFGFGLPTALRNSTLKRLTIATAFACGLSVSAYAYYFGGYLTCHNTNEQPNWGLLGPDDDSKRITATMGGVINDGTTTVNMEVDWDDGTTDSLNQTVPQAIFWGEFHHQYADNGTRHIKLNFEAATWYCDKEFTISFPLQ